MKNPIMSHPVPPEESRGNAIPLVGASPVTTMRFTIACTEMVRMIQRQAAFWNGLVVARRIFSPAHINAI